MTTRKYCFALDLKDDIELISAYKKQHLQVWPEIISSIKATGIIVMDLYIIGNRLFMIMEVDANFSFEKKSSNGFTKSSSDKMGRINVDLSASIAMGNSR